MPWSGKQHRLFEVAAHNPQVAARVGIPVAKVAQMASEGIKREPNQKGKMLARAIRGR